MTTTSSPQPAPLSNLTYDKIEANMRRVMNRLDEVLAEFARVNQEYAIASADLKVGRASARINLRNENKGDSGIRVTDQLADDHATVATSDECYRESILARECEVAKASLNTLRAQLEGLRSLMSSYRTQDGGG